MAEVCSGAILTHSPQAMTACSGHGAFVFQLMNRRTKGARSWDALAPAWCTSDAEVFQSGSTLDSVPAESGTYTTGGLLDWHRPCKPLQGGALTRPQPPG